jgi:hypothetical protein
MGDGEGPPRGSPAIQTFLNGKTCWHSLYLKMVFQGVRYGLKVFSQPDNLVQPSFPPQDLGWFLPCGGKRLPPGFERDGVANPIAGAGSPRFITERAVTGPVGLFLLVPAVSFQYNEDWQNFGVDAAAGIYPALA